MSSNPYQVTSTHDDKMDFGDFAWLGSSGIHSWEGRISRLPYFLVSLGINLLYYLATVMLAVLLEGFPAMMVILFLFLSFYIVYVSICLAVKRLHDLNHPGLYWLLNLIPCVNAIFGLYLLFAPGMDGPNDYGDPPNWGAMGYSSQYGWSDGGGYHQTSHSPSPSASLDPLQNWASEAKANPERIESWEWYYQEAQAQNDTKHMLIAGKHLIRLYMDMGYSQEAYGKWWDLRALNFRLGDKHMLTLATDLEVEDTDAAVEVLTVLVEEGSPQDQLAPVCRLAARIAPELAKGLLDRFLELALISPKEKAELIELSHQLGCATPPMADDPFALPSTPKSPESNPFSYDEPAPPSPPSADPDPFGGSHGHDAFGMATVPAHIQVREIMPKGLQRTGLVIAVGKRDRNIRYTSINAIAVGAIKQPGGKPFLVIDIVLPKSAEGHLRVLRATTKSFNPLKVMPNSGNGKESLLAFVDKICRESAATALPSLAAIQGRPFASFESLDDMSIKLYANDNL